MPFNSPIVAGNVLVIPAIQSVDYEQAENGWRIGRDGSAQFANATFLGDVNVPNLFGNDIQAGKDGIQLYDGRDVGHYLDIVDQWQNRTELRRRPYPGEIVAGGSFNLSNVKNASQSTGGEVGIAAVSTYQIPRGVFKVSAGPLLVKVNKTPNASTSLQCDIRWETSFDGSAPPWPNNNTSPYFLRGGRVTPTVAGRYYSIYPGSGIFRTGDDNDWFKFLLSYSIQNPPSGGSVVLFTGGSSSLAFYVTYLGKSDIRGSSGTARYSRFHSIFAVGGDIEPDPPPPHEPTKHHVTHYMSWNRVYDGSGHRVHKHSGINPNRYLYQGGVWSDGNMKSTFGLSASAKNDIHSRLNGATNITCRFYFTPAHTYYSAGADIELGTCAWTSPEATWGGASNFKHSRWRMNGCKANREYEHNMPPGEVADGDISGWTIGPAPGALADYIYLYQAGSGNGPRIEITYWK